MESAEAFVDLVLGEGWMDYENGDTPERAIALVKSRDEAISQAVMKATEPRWFDIREQVPSNGQLCVVASAESIFGLAQWGTLEPVLVRDWVYPWAPNYTCIFDPSAVFWFPLPPLPNVVIWQGKVSAVVH